MRLDLHTDRRLAPRRRYRRLAGAPDRGVNTEGRFVGPNAFDRGWRHFWNAPHRRNHAPLERSILDFPVKGRESAVTPEQLRAMHLLRHLGPTAIAHQLGLPVATVGHHLRDGGSASLRRALAAV
jgi:hypothetical protein